MIKGQSQEEFILFGTNPNHQSPITDLHYQASLSKLEHELHILTRDGIPFSPNASGSLIYSPKPETNLKNIYSNNHSKAGNDLDNKDLQNELPIDVEFRRTNNEMETRQESQLHKGNQ